MGGIGSGKPKGELMILDGHAIVDGKMKKSDFFNFLGTDLQNYSHVNMTPTQAATFKNSIIRMTHGVSAAIPMLCGGPRCPNKLCPFHDGKNWPLGLQCHPPGTLIKLGDGTSVPIEELDHKEHGVTSFFRKKSLIRTNYRNGYDFDITSREYNGRLLGFRTKDAFHETTPEHISIVRFNEKAFGKFCVYLMRKGNLWRIGKSTVCNYSKGIEKKAYSGFINRAKTEKADSIWVLGVYDTNTEALLAEEYFSIKWHTSRACFVVVDSTKKKYNDLYRWVTEEQLLEHHTSLSQHESFYRQKLNAIGLSIDYPIWDKTHSKRDSSSIKFYSTYPMFINSCNIIPEIMDIPVFPKGYTGRLHEAKVSWQSVSIEQRNYSGLVYSLGVHNNYKTYFANEIATHNCLYEVRMIQTLTRSYMEDIGVSPDSPTEMSLINKLVECDVIDFRSNLGLSGATDAEAATLLHTTTTDDGKGGMTETVALHPLMDAKDRAHRIRLQILDSLAFTRREKYKKAAALKQSEDSDASTFLADLKEKFATKTIAGVTSLDKIKEDAKKISEDIITDVDWSADE